MMNFDNMFSVFISFIAVGVEEGSFARAMLATVIHVSNRAKLSVGPPRSTSPQEGIASRAERMMFDIRAGDVLLQDCDIVMNIGDDLAILNIGMPQHAFLLEQVQNCSKKDGLIWDLVSASFDHPEIVAAKVATEDSFSLEGLDEFRPGDWNVFRKERLPDFLWSVRPQVTSEKASFYTSGQINALRITEAEMGLSLVRALGLKK